MKRLLAFLLALMLPACALAETYQVHLETKADETIFPIYVKELLQKIPGLLTKDAEKYVTAISTLMKNTEVTVTAQDDACSMDIKLSGSSLIDLTVYQTDKASCLTSSLLPGYALVEPLTGAEASTQLEENEWKRITKSVDAAIDAWLKDIEKTEMQGIFEGDAYSGGTRCTTWMLTDKDISSLMSSVMTADLRSLMTWLFGTSSVMDAATFLAAFDDANARVAKEDKFSYVLRVVKNDADEFVGLSLSVFEKSAQLATLSFGMQDEKARLVVGLGLNGRNYWWEAMTQRTQRDQVTYLKGEMREWVADKSQAYAYVNKTNAAVTSCVWTCNLTKSGQRTLWDGCVYEGGTVDKAKAVCTFNGAMNSTAKTLESGIKLMQDGRTALEAKLDYKPVSPINPIGETVTLCSVGDPAQEKLYTELNQKLNYGITARMFQLIPIDVIFTLSELFSE